MKLSSLFGAVLALSVSSVAIAADDAAIKERQFVKTVDGRKVGAIDRVLRDADGNATGVKIIFNGRFIVIPASTLTPADKGLVTSLTSQDVRKL